MFKEELMSILNTWSYEQLNEYIKQLETRIEDSEKLLREVKAIRKKKSGKKVYDTGTRGGMG